MRSIMGVQKITAGSITVLGSPAGTPSLRTRLAFSSQDLSIYKDLTVRENVSYFARLDGAPASPCW
ncbi:hypothetical protein [Corynebacterium pyruviciproducens]|nr:hypothetical protein [Corynebacterium pyruviciproducens]